ncbi:hypothetical protein crov490 [Cafeteria roenbergensis virus]|uniref:Uncharacterized protein n=1 Tax=Cafeteria roenbergensis virus (strain BV-PW1) TaxID=693272 RepID=E3T5R1_CROVB|nr:hypothetical protein crov490 [Cafeteria roenbergensis virus BV-PW1]ADO67524.1 hypothetical protein crov490 [Cafeteria roenbergensis virus BV-PW1]
MPITSKDFSNYNNNTCLVDKYDKLYKNSRCISIISPDKTLLSGEGSEDVLNIVGPPIIYTGNSFSSTSCIPCGNYCSDLN